MTTLPSFDNTLGALFIGFSVSTVRVLFVFTRWLCWSFNRLYGMFLLQVLNYYRRYPLDKAGYKAIVSSSLSAYPCTAFMSTPTRWRHYCSYSFNALWIRHIIFLQSIGDGTPSFHWPCLVLLLNNVSLCGRWNVDYRLSNMDVEISWTWLRSLANQFGASRFFLHFPVILTGTQVSCRAYPSLIIICDLILITWLISVPASHRGEHVASVAIFNCLRTHLTV